MKPSIFFRCDGNQTIGYGHFFRCFSIAERTREDYRNTFLLKSSDLFVKQQLIELDVPFIELPILELMNEAKFLSKEILKPIDQIVIDGYEFRTDYILQIKKSGSRCIYVDDLHSWQIPSDVVINHAPGVSREYYSNIINQDTDLYTGLDYALIRNFFIDNLSMERKGDFKGVLICFGGIDFHELVTKLAQAFLQLPENFGVTIVSGHPRSLESFSGVKILSNQSGEEMAELMRENDIIICPPSTLSIEAFFSRMMIMLVQTAENQTDIKNGMMNFENVKSLGSLQELDNNLSSTIQNSVEKWGEGRRALKPFELKFDRRKLLNIFTR